MKKFIKLLLLITVFIVLSVQPAMAKTVYYDTYNHWASSDIDFTSNTLKVFKGYGDFTFRPENNITRAEFITILAKTAYRQNKMNEIYTSDMPYSDMTNQHWSYTFIISMYEHLKPNQDYTFEDIFPGSNFYPDKAITREESVALIAAFCKDAIYDNPLNFNDIRNNSKYYNEIKRLYNAGIVSGYEDRTFKGNNNITRAESAALIKRVYYDIKTSDQSNYLTKLEFLPIKGEEIYSYFGSYNWNTANNNDKRYIKAKDTLEYVSFGGYIFPEDKHLYDLNAVETMEALRSEGYSNITGTNFYLITFGNYSDDEKSQFANDMLANVIERNDLKDSELMQIFAMASKYAVQEDLYMSALEKWDSLTSSNNAKANILFFRYAFYIKNNNEEMLKTLVYDDLKKANNIPSLLNINWGLAAGSEKTDFRNYTFGSYSFSLYKDTTLYRYTLSPVMPVSSSSKIVELVNLLMIEKSVKPSTESLTNYESIFSKYSLNRLYVLNFIGEKERAFVEGINDYEIIKTFEIYETNKLVIDDTYTGILKKVKE
ncbi:MULTISPECIES: S-layer homology domain-containing protein [unclassified Sedimentibacter]|uniref:S-layer homology domain-containing protein n=1 Tax=unclassified Sedimentibacter TaxID=2649220 RepID=UPI0027DFF764|nr:S-layer homology domain-containing protein [Sedimentibacter sp. MB35-C1]WMJ76799.1 S-layer homology domain-containing protein [Sedimentibacter sp. MB35-C1]